MKTLSLRQSFYLGNTAPFLASGSGSLQEYTNQRSSLPHSVPQKKPLSEKEHLRMEYSR